MGWRDLVGQDGPKTIVMPWVQGRVLQYEGRTLIIRDSLPPEQGWARFLIEGRIARFEGFTEAEPDLLVAESVTGYLVGDRLIADSVRAATAPETLVGEAERIFLVEPGLNRFCRLVAARTAPQEPLIYRGLVGPLGPEYEVQEAFEDNRPDLGGVKGVSPALEATFKVESWRRAEAERQRALLEAERRAERERQAAEDMRERLLARTGTASGRRELARVDFSEAARAALALGGAVYLDSNRADRPGEMIVRFRMPDPINRRIACVCDATTLRVVDSGICLNDYRTGVSGDRLFTLESLPGVIAAGYRQDKLVVFEHRYG
jgi:hypothetical protein